MTTVNPDLIRHIITEEEIPLRCRSFKPTTVEAIFRYGAVVGSVVEQHEQLPRGMDRARQLIVRARQKGAALASGTTIVAARMTDSKGRFRRAWHAPAGGLWLTVVLADTLLPDFSRLYPLAAGIACCETLRVHNLQASIKWVNDIHIRTKKIAGILAETESDPAGGETYVLLGIGINVNNTDFPADLENTATSMQAELGAAVDITTVTARLLAKLSWSIGLLCYEEERFLRHRGLSSEQTVPNNLLLDQWRHLSDIAGRRVLFGYDVQKHPLFEAVVRGLDNTGALLLRLPDGKTVVENSGEILYLD
jgi:BirA family biotin operon repressor/biotin-[acetyl-CoA-carboxylase] ligase